MKLQTHQIETVRRFSKGRPVLISKTEATRLKEQARKDLREKARGR